MASTSHGPAFKRFADRKEQAGGAGVERLRHAERQQIDRKRRPARMGHHRGDAGGQAGERRLERRARTRLDLAAAEKPQRGEHQRHHAHHDLDGMPVEIAQHEIAEADADDERRQQHREVDARPRARAPEPQRGDVHDDEQWCQQRARRDRVHRQRQQRDADDGKTAAERALHEGDQEDAGEGNREHERPGQVSDDGRDHGVVRSVVVSTQHGHARLHAQSKHCSRCTLLSVQFGVHAA
ncbi:hypothetical protein ACVIHF_004948 [Bradyrhizobium sp. USDA 4506]